MNHLSAKRHTYIRLFLTCCIAIVISFSYSDAKGATLQESFAEAFKPHSFTTMNLIIVNDALTDKAIDELTKKLGATFSSKIIHVKINTSLDNAYDKERARYDSRIMLGMESIFKGQKNGEYDIALIPGDLYTSGFNFLFSDTDPALERTIMGLARLKPSDDNQQLLINRVYKMFLRRVGAMVPLGSTCGPMGFSNSLDELDKKPDQYCSEDADSLRKHGIIR